jgi:DNA-binding NarL/FixJ family response regulator
MFETELERARECCTRREWRVAWELFARVDRTTPLPADDLLRLATSAYLIGREADYHRYLERAHRQLVHAGDQSRAARCAFWLGLTLLLRGDTGQANGWLARAERLVEGRDCVEHGYLLLPLAEQQLDAGNGDAAFAAAARAAEVGDVHADADLTACARHVQGRALIQQGRVQQGLRLLDEAMIAVCRGELSPIVTGLIYCSVIEACQQVFALGRAREWTEALARWCEQQPGMVAFTGTCLVHRAAVLQFRGAWTAAMTEARKARERAAQEGERQPLAAAAFYRQGEIHRLRGELEAAEEAYRTANRMGMEPQPGLALLRLAQGRAAPAGAALGRVLSAATDPLRRAELLPAYVEISLDSGNTVAARGASRELDETAERYDTEVLRAMAAHARGALELAEGRAPAALVALRRAFELWHRGEAPYEAARARLLAALACREAGDAESADLEFDAAKALFLELGAAPDVARVDALRHQAPRRAPQVLTPRELQVLRLVAAGKTNKAIAAGMSVSERTVDRHVSNILTKLGVPSRAAATAWAYDHELL